MKIDFSAEMNPQSFFCTMTALEIIVKSACVFPTKFLDQYARCCALGRKNTRNGFFWWIYRLFDLKIEKKEAENRASSATIH